MMKGRIIMSNDFIVVDMLLTDDKMAIKKDCVITFYEDSFKVNEAFHSGSGQCHQSHEHEIECVTIEYMGGNKIEWVKVSNSFEDILRQMKTT